jgi:fumarate hydratase class II
MGSGPRSGLGELRLPSLQPGSSIMPGKVNPVVPEAVLQAAAQVVGNDAAVAFAAAAGNFELNVMMPVMARNALEAARILARAADVLRTLCVDGLQADAARCMEYAAGSASVATPLNRYIGYDAAARVAKEAVEQRRSIRDVVIAHGHVESGKISLAELDAALSLRAMAHPHAPAE